MEINARVITKKIASVVVGLGTTKISADIISTHARPNNPIQLVTVAVASVAIGYMAADKTSEYTERKIDAMFDWFEETKAEIKKDKTDSQEA